MIVSSKVVYSRVQSFFEIHVVIANPLLFFLKVYFRQLMDNYGGGSDSRTKHTGTNDQERAFAESNPKD